MGKDLELQTPGVSFLEFDFGFFASYNYFDFRMGGSASIPASKSSGMTGQMVAMVI